MIKAVLFDLDGVLVDADYWHFEALNRALQEHGYNITHDQHLHFYKGIPTKVKLKILSIKEGLPEHLHDYINRRKQEHSIEIIEALCKPVAHKVEMIDALKQAGYKIAVCSNSIRHTTELMLYKSGLLDKMGFILSNEDVTNPKPHPEIYLEACRRLNLDPNEVLIVEDSVVGLSAALASGANICAVAGPEEVNLFRINQSLQGANKMKIVIPMAGKGSRFANAGYKEPKPLIKIQGKPMIQYVVKNLKLPAQYIFVCLGEHLDAFPLQDLFNQILPDSHIVVRQDGYVEGAISTIMLAKNHLIDNSELLVANSDQFVDYDISKFVDDMRAKDADGGILVFRDTNPKWSFAKIDLESGQVVEVAEKRPISDLATVGIYYYKKAADFIKYAQAMINKNIRVNNEFYVCPVFNEYISDGKKIFVHEMPTEKMHGLGTPEDLDIFLAKNIIL